MQATYRNVPPSLRIWFIIHFAVDMLFALPLFFAPQATLALFGLNGAETITARLVAAALFGIGGVSLIAARKGKESYGTLLTLKIIWSAAAILGIALSIVEGAPLSAWLFLGTFVLFAGVWIYYKVIRE